MWLRRNDLERKSAWFVMVLVSGFTKPLQAIPSTTDGGGEGEVGSVMLEVSGKSRLSSLRCDFTFFRKGHLGDEFDCPGHSPFFKLI